MFGRRLPPLAPAAAALEPSAALCPSMDACMGTRQHIPGESCSYNRDWQAASGSSHIHRGTHIAGIGTHRRRRRGSARNLCRRWWHSGDRLWLGCHGVCWAERCSDRRRVGVDWCRGHHLLAISNHELGPAGATTTHEHRVFFFAVHAPLRLAVHGGLWLPRREGTCALCRVTTSSSPAATPTPTTATTTTPTAVTTTLRSPVVAGIPAAQPPSTVGGGSSSWTAQGGGATGRVVTALLAPSTAARTTRVTYTTKRGLAAGRERPQHLPCGTFRLRNRAILSNCVDLVLELQPSPRHGAAQAEGVTTRRRNKATHTLLQRTRARNGVAMTAAAQSGLLLTSPLETSAQVRQSQLLLLSRNSSSTQQIRSECPANMT